MLCKLIDAAFPEAGQKLFTSVPNRISIRVLGHANKNSSLCEALPVTAM